MLLYVLFFAVPLVGWAYSSAAGFPIVWFGVLPLPELRAGRQGAGRAIKPGMGTSPLRWRPWC
jgi:cytochrome b561